ncbi:MAG: phosphonopyruvate decarboxylase, partial [Burkholderiales bacterium]
VNALGMVQVCRFPLVMIVTMRGEQGEFNPWQVPMGRSTPQVLEAMGVSVRRASSAKEVAPLVAEAFKREQAVAVLVSQGVIGIKSFQEQSDR